MAASSWRATLALLALLEVASPRVLAASPLRGVAVSADKSDSHIVIPGSPSELVRGTNYAPSLGGVDRGDALAIALSSVPASRALGVSGASPLELTAPTSVAVAQGKPVFIPVQAVDPDGDRTLTVTVSGAPSFLSVSGATGISPLTATLSGVPAPSDAGAYKIVWTLSCSDDLLATVSRTTTLTVGGAALDAPQTPGASIVGYTTYGNYVLVSEGTNGIDARLGVWGSVWPWGYCQQEVGYPCTYIANRILVEIDIQEGAWLGFDCQFMQYGTPFLSDDLQAVLTDGAWALEVFLWNFGNPVSCWGNLWQSGLRSFRVDLRRWPNRHVFLDIWVRDCLGHQTDALALVNSIGIRECYVAPLAPLSPEDQAMFEDHPNTPAISGLTPAMQSGLSCLQSAIEAEGGQFAVKSAYRTESYQAHLREVYKKWKTLGPDSTKVECEEFRTYLRDHIYFHELQGLGTEPATNGLHPQGLAIDASWSGVADIDALACPCGLYRPLKIADRRHFILRPCPP